MRQRLRHLLRAQELVFHIRTLTLRVTPIVERIVEAGFFTAPEEKSGRMARNLCATIFRGVR